MSDKREVIHTPDSPDLGKFLGVPVAPATRGAGLFFTTGYVAINPETGAAETGAVEIETRRTLDNLKLILEHAGSSLDKVLRVHIFMTDLNDWPKMNAVYQEYFPTDPPARRTVGAPLIPGFRVEIDCIALA